MTARYVQVDDLGLLRTVCKKMAFLPGDSSTKHGGRGQVGDRMLSASQQQLSSSVLECVVEGVRAGIQTGHYTCDYSTKPAMTCGSVLKHLTHGMAQLEAQLEKEAAERQAQRILAAFPAGQAPFNVPAAGDEPFGYLSMYIYISLCLSLFAEF